MQGRSATPVKKCWRVFFIMLAVPALSVSAHLQTAQKNKTFRPKAPELRLRIIPDKETYVLHEKIFTKTELLNLTDKTLCFPVPDQQCEDTYSGSLITTGEDAASAPGDQFICHLDGGGVPRDRLFTDVEQHWIKIAPNAAQMTKSSEAHVSLATLGRWRLQAIYHPPEAAFGDAVEYRAYLQAAAEKFGCTVPEIEATAKPVTVSIVPPPDQNQSVK